MAVSDSESRSALEPELGPELLPTGSEEPSEELKEQNQFYGDRLGFLLTLIILLSVSTLFFFVLLISLQSIRSPQPLFFQSSPSAQLIQETALDQPGMSVNQLYNWLVEGLINSHSFNFVNYETKIQVAKEYFTSEGYDSFTRALQDNHIMDKIIEKKYVFRGLPSAAPQIIKEGVLANHYLWKIKLPMTFQYRNVRESIFDLADLTVLVVRVPTDQSAFGIKILRYELVIKGGGYN